VISPQEFDTAQAQADSAAGLAEAARQQYEQALTGPRPEDIAQARAALAAAEASRDRVVAGPRSEEIDAARARVAQSEATLAQMDVDLAEMDIVASRDAHLEIFDLRPGDLVAPNQTVATLVLPNSLWVRVYIPEDRLGWVHVGQPLDVRVDTWPGEVFHGFIDQINRRAEFTPRNVQTVEERIKQVFGVRVRLDNSSDKLRPGMAADVTIPAPAAGANSSSRIPVASPNSSSRNSVAGEATP
jgi:HlyD family secretion protein